MSTNHSWKFFRAGGFDQVRLDSGADLMQLEKLDQKLWVALACPTTGLEFDSRTLALIDTDKDGRIRAPEIIAATKWALGSLTNPDDLLKSAPALPLASINDATPEGKQLLSSAKEILRNLQKPEAAEITIEETLDTTKIFAQTSFNGDGIVPVESAEDDATKGVITDIIACLGPEMDRSGKPGVSQAKVDQFFVEAQAFSDWWKKAEGDATVLPLDGSTANAALTFRAVRQKVEDYFTRCQLAAFDPRAVSALNREEKEYLTFAGKDLSLSSAEIASFPLAQVSAGKPLPLKNGVNPAWADVMGKFEAEVVNPVLGSRTALTEEDWGIIRGKLAGFETWSAGKTGALVEKLGLKRVREILGGKSKEAITALIARDKALEPEANAIAAVERLVRYHRDLYKLLNNFVSFRDFYRKKDKAIFQAGTLYLDQRACELCMTVEESGRHALMAGLAGTYLAYCDCVRKATGEKMQIVAAFTGGDSDNLMVGRNGIFYDRKGRDWDATIAKIIDNPISIRQAFWSPYKKFVRMVEEQIAKRAAAADAASSDQLAQAAANVAKADAIAAQQAGKPVEPKKLDVGVVAAMGVAVGAIGGALASLATGLIRLPTWQIPLVFVGVMLLISLPSMVIAWLKLRKRNLGPILDANGWAVNARARINLPFGASLTQVAVLPAGARRDLVDPFADKKSPWPRLIVVLIILAIAYAILNRMGYIYEWTKGRLGEPRAVKVETVTVKPASTSAAAPTPPAVPGTPAAPATPAEVPK
ncbi:MAG TPA: hypothetical protein VLT36_00560 [Candidatus Dormibacteraeota bacterium]|nr:hypothetical protein [Candidatus Dormibacteraeota bacterium]